MGWYYPSYGYYDDYNDGCHRVKCRGRWRFVCYD